MFTGIIEEVGEVVETRRTVDGTDLVVRARMSPGLRVDQSVAHDGVCLTVTRIDGDHHTVTAVAETLAKSNLGDLKPGDRVNLERSLRLGDRLDGHLVQGHVDTVTECVAVRHGEDGGGLSFSFRLPERRELLVHKGSICLNGVSLTIADLGDETFSVAIIPYTYEHTTFRDLRPGMRVNVEYDVIGKYVERMMGRGGR